MVTDQKIKGTVLEVHNAASYTYLKVKDQTAKEQWAAVLQIAVKQGQKVEINQQVAAGKRTVGIIHGNAIG